MVQTRIFTLFFALGLVLAPSAAVAQQGEVGREEALRAFIDCRHCDRDHFRREITFVNYVRYREDAQVHVLITLERTGSGGLEYTLNFIGREEFTGDDQTTVYTSSATDIRDEVRDGLTQTLKLGLLRYVAGTPLAERIEVSYEPEPGMQAVATPESDPWNFWIFRVRVGGRIDGESQTEAYSVSGGLAASRVTEDWKIRLSASGWYREDRFEFDDEEPFISIARDYDGGGLLVKSLGGHWAVGARASASSSTYSNEQLTLRFAPGLEFNVFPYAESTRRQFTLMYTIGVNRYEYREETIFGVTEETLPDQALNASLEVTQPWGSAFAALEASHYLKDFEKNRIDFYGELDVRLVRGLSLSLSGDVSRVRDQLNLPKGGATEEEVLLRRRELETSYEFGVSVGFSYTFGSAYSNVVNPRFRN